MLTLSGGLSRCLPRRLASSTLHTAKLQQALDNLLELHTSAALGSGKDDDEAKPRAEPYTSDSLADRRSDTQEFEPVRHTESSRIRFSVGTKSRKVRLLGRSVAATINRERELLRRKHAERALRRKHAREAHSQQENEGKETATQGQSPGDGLKSGDSTGGPSIRDTNRYRTRELDHRKWAQDEAEREAKVHRRPLQMPNMRRKTTYNTANIAIYASQEQAKSATSVQDRANSGDSATGNGAAKRPIKPEVEKYPSIEALSKQGAARRPIKPAAKKQPQIEELSEQGAAKRPLKSEVKKQPQVQELSAQEIEDFRKAAEESSINMPRSPVNAVREDAKNSEGAISILEEMFPKELKMPKRTAAPMKPERKIPKALIDLPMERDGERRESSSVDSSDDAKEATRGGDTAREEYMRKEESQTTLLVLRKASKHLTESDFQRIAPGSRHIQGWSTRGQLLRVIRSRDTKTLSRTGDYFLVFSDTESAEDYLAHAQRLHEHSKVFSPQPIPTTVPPPPKINDTGRGKFDNPAYTYNLVTPSHELSLRLTEQPFPPLLRNIVELGGYPALLADRQSQHEVLLTFVTSLKQISYSVVRRAIDQDGKARGSFWQTTGNRLGIRDLDHVMRPERFEDKGSKRWAPATARQYIISFRTQAEAARFTASWHQRDVTRLIEAQLPMSLRADKIMAVAEETW